MTDTDAAHYCLEMAQSSIHDKHDDDPTCVYWRNIQEQILRLYQIGAIPHDIIEHKDYAGRTDQRQAAT